MISIRHKFTKLNRQTTFKKEVAKLVATYQKQDGFSHYRIVTSAASQHILLTFWQSKQHYRRAVQS